MSLLSPGPQKQPLEEPLEPSQAESISHTPPSAEPGVSGTAQGPLPDLPELSKQVYVVGFTTKAKYVAHSLAPIPQIPPVKILTHHSTNAVNAWLNANKAIDLHDGYGKFLSSHSILCPQYIGPKIGAARIDTWEGERLDNIIMSCSTGSIYPTLRNLRPHITNRTVLCLIHDGLGMIDELNRDIFDDPAYRPMYVLGQLTHKLRRHRGKDMSMRSRSPEGGRAHFLLTALPTEPDGGTNYHDVARRVAFVELVALSKALNPISIDNAHFLHRKLPGMIWSSAADAVSVILGCRYDQILRDLHAVRLWHALVNEAMNIAASLPELNDAMRQVFAKPEFKRQLRWKLETYRMVYSEWVALIRKGEITPVDSVNGYFVRRGAELGLPHKVHSMAVSMVKARHEARNSELKDDIPYSLRPYMLDSDRLGGQEFTNDEDLAGLNLDT